MVIKLHGKFLLLLIFLPALIWGQCPGTVSISANPGNNICADTPVTFTATANGGSGTFSYQWQINGINEGTATTDNTFTSSTLANGDRVRVIVTTSADASCSTNSSQITMTVNQNKTPTVAFSTSPSLKCVGSTVTFTASNTNGGANPNYEWFIDGTSVQSSSSNSFSTNTLSAGDHDISVELTSTLTCVTDTTAYSTSTITITDDATITSPSNTDQSNVCINSGIVPIVFTISGSGNSATVSGLPTGVTGNYSSSNFTISGTPSITGTFLYTVTASGPCGSDTATGTITVLEDATIDLTSANNNQTVCQDLSITNITYDIGETGTGATISGLPTGISGSYSGGVYTISGSSNITGTHNYSITATGTCGDSETLTGSITINENLTPAVSITSSDADNMICEGSQITFTATPTNGGSAPSFQWKIGSNNVGSDSPTFSTNALAVGDQSVSVVLTSNETCLTQAIDTSNIIVTTVNENLTPDVTVSASDSDICDGDEITFTATPTNGGTAPSYQWKVDGNNVGTNSDTFVTTSLSNGQNVTVVLTSNETCLTTTTATSSPIATTVNPNLTPEVTITSNDTNNIICAGGNITFTASPVNGGANPSYQWYVDGSPTGTNSSSFSTNGLTNGQTVKVLMTSNEECLASVTAESNEISIQVDNSLAAITPSFDNTNPAHNPTAICPVASGIIYKVTPVSGATTYNWTLPTGFTITSGAGTNQITVTANSNAASGTVRVTAGNECGSSLQLESQPLSIGTVVHVSAGPDQTVCLGTNTIQLAGEIGGVIKKKNDFSWSASVTGGTFPTGNVNQILTGNYTLPPTIRDNGGTIIIKITSVDPAGPCGPKEDEMVLTVLTNATINNPANKNQTVCINNDIEDISFNIANAGTGASFSNLPTGLSGNYLDGVFTISGTPTEAGSFNYTVNTTGSCTSQQTSQTGIITVTADQSITDPANKDQEICINNAITDIIFSTNPSVTNASVTGLPAGLNGSFTSGSYTISGTVSEAGTFNYTVTTSGDCINATRDGIITVLPDPTIDSPTNKDQEICINTPITDIQFNITSPGTDATVTGLPPGISGSFNNGVYTLTGTPSVDGTFDYTVTTVSNCNNVSQTGQIIVNPDPTAVISYAGEFCTSQSGTVAVELSGTGSFENGDFYSSPAGLSLDTTTGGITPGTSTPGTYTVNYDTTSGCVTFTAQTTVIINELPFVEIDYEAPFCTSDGTAQSVTFTNGIGAYQNGAFSATPGGLDIDAATGNINAQTSSPNTYTVFYTIPATLGCDEVVVQSDVTITQLPQVSISYDTPLCNSDITIYNVSYGSTAGDYLGGIFSGTPGLSIDANGSINPQNSTPGSHTVTYTKDTDDDGCVPIEATFDIEIFDQVQITTQPENFGTCSSNAASFEVIATGDNLVYQWYKKDAGGTFIQINGETSPTLSFNNATSANAGEYQVVVSSSNGACSSATSDPVTLNIDEEIIITKPVEDITICEDDFDSLSFEYEAHANGADLDFQWVKDGGDINPLSGRYVMTETGPTGPDGVYTGTLTIENINLSDDGVYAVKITGPESFTCSEAISKTFTFRVNPRPSPPGTSNIEYCLNAIADPLTATMDSTDNELLWYSYDITTEDYTYLGTSVTPDTDIATTISYWVSQRQPNGCESDPAEIVVTVNDKPNPIATETIEFSYCFNEVVTDPVSIDPDAGSTINWYDAIDATTALGSAPTPNASTVGVTSYWVSQTLTSTGCESDRTQVDIIINPLPVIDATVATGYDADICLNGQTNLTATGATSYTWYYNGGEIGTGNEITITGDAIGSFEYEVTGIDDNGCINTDLITINVEEPSVGGITSGPSSVCVTQNEGIITLTDFTGDILRWESSTDGTNWNAISETTDTLNFQNISSTTSFRAVVKNGVCDEETSIELSVSLDQEPVAGGVLFSGTDRVFMMCEFPTAEYLVPLQLSGTYVGEIVAWQYRRNSQAGWTNIQENGVDFTGNSLTGMQVNDAANNESTLFRVEVQSGACQPNVFSDYATLSIIPSDIAPSPVEITPGEVCLGEIVSMSSSTGYGGSGTFQGGAFDNSAIANHGWRVMRFDDQTEYTFESAADNIRPNRWLRTNPHDYQMAHPSGNGSIIYQRFDSCSCDAGNKGFAIVSGNNPSTLETPVFNLYTMDNPVLTFDQAYNLTYSDTIRVEISTDGGNTYNDILMEIGGPPNPGDPPTVSGNYALFGDDHLGPPNNMELDLSNYAGLNNLRVRWLYDGTTGGIYTIDDIGLPEDPQNVQLIWYYDEDINDDTNTLEQIGEVNQSTVTYPQNGAEWPKIGWNDFEVQTALVFDTNGDPCESAENSAVASVYVFDNYTSTATAQVGQCGDTDVQLNATITSAFYQDEITEFPEGEGSTLAWEVIEAPTGYTFSEAHFVNSDASLEAINDPNATFQPPVPGIYKLRWAITPNESQTTRDILGEMVTQDISANPCPMTHIDTDFVFTDCTTLDFDGDDDYIDLGNNYNGNYFIEAWIRPFDRALDDGSGNTNASTGVIFSSSGMEIRMEDLPASVAKNGRWYHIAVANNGDLWVDGVDSGNIDISGSGINNTSIGARYNASTKTTSNHFSGWIEELRIWNTQPTEKQIRFMMNQRLKLDATGTVASPLQGEVVPNLVIADGGLSSYHTNGTYNLDKDDTPFYNLTTSDLAGYYRLYSDIPDPANLIPGYFDPALEPSGGFTPDHAVTKIPGRLYNITTDQENTSPTPYFSKQGGNWEDLNTWARPAVWDHPNSSSGGTPIDWNIARINHNINSGDKHITMLGLLSETVDMELSIIPDHFLRISHYLLLHGNMDLEGESQLLQDHGSILDNASQGWAQIDQQGRMSSYNYNYWTSPVSNQKTDNNSGFMLNQVMFDGTNPNSPKGINWQPGYFSADGARTDAITISTEWIWDFRGGNADIYGDWLHLGSDYTEIVGAGFSMKGTDGTVAPNTQQQNYIFQGKPNNGNIPTTDLYLQNNQNFLVGNPYLSAIDAEEFLRDNLVNVGTGTGNNQNNQNVFNGTLYYWDHFAGSTHILEEYIGGYATFTLSGSAPAISNDWRINSVGGSNNIVPERYIPVAQGFFLNSAPVAGQNFAGDIIFDNTQRIYKRESVDPSIFLQQEDDIVKGEQQTSNEDQRMKIRLKFESPKGYHRQILVTRDENTSNGFDVGYDAPLIENNIEDMYWWFDENRFVIQGVPDFEKEQVLPLAVKTNAGGEFKIKIDKTENWPADKELYLKDKLSDSIHDILKQAYIGNTEVTGEITDRFELVFFKEQAEDPIATEPDPDDILNPDLPIIDDLVGISYSTFSKQVKISNFDLLDVDKVLIYDMGGKLIQEFDDLPTEQEILLGMRPVRSGVYIVKVFCQNGICNKKIIVK